MKDVLLCVINYRTSSDLDRSLTAIRSLLKEQGHKGKLDVNIYKGSPYIRPSIYNVVDIDIEDAYAGYEKIILIGYDQNFVDKVNNLFPQKLGFGFDKVADEMDAMKDLSRKRYEEEMLRRQRGY